VKNVRVSIVAPLALLVASACGGGSPHLSTVPVARDAIAQNVTASGTLAAQDTVLVGSQVSTLALPLTAVIDALRAQILQGVSLSQLTPQLAIITGWLVVCFFTALRLFRWR